MRVSFNNNNNYKQPSFQKLWVAKDVPFDFLSDFGKDLAMGTIKRKSSLNTLFVDSIASYKINTSFHQSRNKRYSINYSLDNFERRIGRSLPNIGRYSKLIGITGAFDNLKGKYLTSLMELDILKESFMKSHSLEWQEKCGFWIRNLNKYNELEADAFVNSEMQEIPFQTWKRKFLHGELDIL